MVATYVDNVCLNEPSVGPSFFAKLPQCLRSQGTVWKDDVMSRLLELCREIMEQDEATATPALIKLTV